MRKIIGKNIARARKLRGLTQEELAEKAEITPNAIQKIEAGQRWPTEKTIKSIARALRVNPFVLLKKT